MNKTLEELRNEIDTIDASIIAMLGKRMDIVKQIGKTKKDLQLEIVDEARWQTVLQKVKNLGKKIYLDESFIESIFTIIHHHAQKLEEKE